MPRNGSAKTNAPKTPGKKSGTSVDMVNHPPHYTEGEIECIDAIKAALGVEGFIAFLRGQVIKYQWRLPHKHSPSEDASKAAWYNARLIEELEALDN